MLLAHYHNTNPIPLMWIAAGFGMIWLGKLTWRLRERLARRVPSDTGKDVLPVIREWNERVVPMAIYLGLGALRWVLFLVGGAVIVLAVLAMTIMYKD